MADKWLAICVKYAHVREVRAPHCNDDDRARHSRQINDDSLCLFHVMDLPVRDQQQNLVNCSGSVGLYVILKLGQEGRKKGRAAEVNLGQCLSVKIDYACNTAAYFGLVQVATEWEAVAQLFPQKIRHGAKAEHGVLLIKIVWLQNFSYLSDD